MSTHAILDPRMPPVRFADLPGLRMAYYVAGDRRGTPVVLCHGFPELAYSWRDQFEPLVDAGWCVIAPDLRGYGLTDAKTDDGAFDMEMLCDDLVALLDHLSVARAVIVGHDWGGALAWNMAMRRAGRVAGVVSLNTPFAARPPADPISIMRQRMGDDMYMVHFQKPGDAERVLDWDVRRTLSYFFRRPLPGVPPGQGHRGARDDSGAAPLALVREIAAYDPALDVRARFLSAEEFDVFASSFERTGFTGGINWYRGMTRNWETAAAYDHRISVPALMVMAELDPYLTPAMADGIERLVPAVETVLLSGTGHWTQQERPVEVSRLLTDWLERHRAEFDRANPAIKPSLGAAEQIASDQ